MMNTSKKRDVQQQRLNVLRLEMDYELAVLFEAIQTKNKENQSKSKEKLMNIREELIKMKAL
ncbi:MULTISPECIES: hypothetical protein [Rossellomorea]|uniref:Uncharacterized protein n=1 Tax=Rossellomorea oryzaecorticis TaxID=1396505 RepID=A0ABW8VJW2_9BACI